VKKKEVNQIQRKINLLTKDDDQRQELWIFYLEGNSEAYFSNYLKKIKEHNSEPERIRAAIHDLIHNPPSMELTDIISGFTELEKSFICFMVLGMTIEEMAEYKGLPNVIVNSIIMTIKQNPRWEKLWEIKRDGDS